MQFLKCFSKIINEFEENYILMHLSICFFFLICDWSFVFKHYYRMILHLQRMSFCSLNFDDIFVRGNFPCKISFSFNVFQKETKISNINFVCFTMGWGVFFQVTSSFFFQFLSKEKHKMISPPFSFSFFV